MIYAFIPALLWALGSVCTARSAGLLGAATTNRWRLTLSVVVLGCWVLLGPGLPRHGVAWGWLLLSGMIGLGLGDLAMMTSYRFVGPRITALLLLCLAVPITGLSEWLWIDTALGWREVALTFGIMVGVALTVMPGARIPAANRRAVVLGVVFGTLAAFGQGLGTTISRVAYRAAELDGVGIDGVSAAWQRMIGGLACTLLAGPLVRAAPSVPPLQLAAEALAPGGHPRPGTAWLWLVASALLGPIVGLSIYQWVLVSHPGAMVQAVAALTPVFVVPFAWWIDGDRPDWRGLLGGAIACASAVLLAAAPRP